MKVILPNLSRLPNMEHFQLMSDTNDILFYIHGQHGEPAQATLQAPVSVLEPFRAKFIELYNREDVAILKIATDELTATIQTAERTRDEAVIGWRFHVRAFGYSIDNEKREAARKLQIVFDSFGEFQKLSSNKQTAATYNFLQEMEAHADNVAIIGGGEWVEDIRKTNEELARLVSQRLDDRAAKSTEDVKVVRQEIDAVLRQMMNFLDITSTLSPTQELISLIDRLNQLMTSYRNTLAQRQGITKAKKEKESPEIVISED